MKYSMKKVRKVVKYITNTDELKAEKIRRVNKNKRDDLLALDEVGFRLEMYPFRGWSKRGSRCSHESSIRGHKNVNAIFMITTKGVFSYKLYNKPIKGPIFMEYLESLNEDLIKNKTLIMDNLRVHHMKVVKELLCKKKVSIEYTIPYSPELNPIEEMFSWIKIKLRSQMIKTQPELEHELSKLVSEINERGLGMYFDHAYGHR
jgi:transposase